MKMPLLPLMLVTAMATLRCPSAVAMAMKSTITGKAISDLYIGSDLTLDKGSSQQATATVKYADGTNANVTKSRDLVWNIGNTDVATVSSTGFVTAVAVGATTIKATYQGKRERVACADRQVARRGRALGARMTPT